MYVQITLGTRCLKKIWKKFIFIQNEYIDSETLCCISKKSKYRSKYLILKTNTKIIYSIDLWSFIISLSFNCFAFWIDYNAFKKFIVVFIGRKRYNCSLFLASKILSIIIKSVIVRCLLFWASCKVFWDKNIECLANVDLFLVSSHIFAMLSMTT